MIAARSPGPSPTVLAYGGALPDESISLERYGVQLRKGFLNHLPSRGREAVWIREERACSLPSGCQENLGGALRQA